MQISVAPLYTKSTPGFLLTPPNIHNSSEPLTLVLGFDAASVNTGGRLLLNFVQIVTDRVKRTFAITLELVTSGIDTWERTFSLLDKRAGLAQDLADVEGRTRRGEDQNSRYDKLHGVGNRE